MGLALYSTTTKRAALALLSASILGPFVILASSAAAWLIENPVAVELGNLAGWSILLLMTALFLVPFLLVIAFPAWLALDLLKARSLPWFVAAGAFLGFTASVWLDIYVFVPSMRHSEGYPDGIVFDNLDVIATADAITSHGWSNALLDAIAPACAGAILGFTIWRIAYRRAAGT